MKNKNIFIVCLFIFLNSNLIFASEVNKELICSSPTKYSDKFYSYFMYNSKMLKHRYPSVYRAVNTDISEKMLDACDSKKIVSANEVYNKAYQMCPQTCSKVIHEYDLFGFFSKEEEENELFNECALVCQLSSNFFQGLFEGHIKSKNKNKTGSMGLPK